MRSFWPLLILIFFFKSFEAYSQDTITVSGLAIAEYHVDQLNEFFFIQYNFLKSDSLGSIIREISKRGDTAQYFILKQIYLDLDSVTRLFKMANRFRNEEMVYLMRGVYNPYIEKYKDDYFFTSVLPINLTYSISNDSISISGSEEEEYRTYKVKLLGKSIFQTYRWNSAQITNVLKIEKIEIPYQ